MDIQEAASHIEQFIAGMTGAQFVQDQKTIYAVVRAFEIIGEAAWSQTFNATDMSTLYPSANHNTIPAAFIR